MTRPDDMHACPQRLYRDFRQRVMPLSFDRSCFPSKTFGELCPDLRENVLGCSPRGFQSLLELKLPSVFVLRDQPAWDLTCCRSKDPSLSTQTSSASVLSADSRPELSARGRYTIISSSSSSSALTPLPVFAPGSAAIPCPNAQQNPCLLDARCSSSGVGSRTITPTSSPDAADDPTGKPFCRLLEGTNATDTATGTARMAIDPASRVDKVTALMAAARAENGVLASGAALQNAWLSPSIESAGHDF